MPVRWTKRSWQRSSATTAAIFTPDEVVVIADATNLKNSFLLLTQLIDLGLPVVLALNMMDLAAKSGQSIDIKKLSFAFDIPVVMINARNGQGIDEPQTNISEAGKAVVAENIFDRPGSAACCTEDQRSF